MSLFAQCRRTERQGLRAAYHSRFLTMNMECLTFSSGLSSNPIQTHVHPPHPARRGRCSTGLSSDPARQQSGKRCDHTDAGRTAKNHDPASWQAAGALSAAARASLSLRFYRSIGGIHNILSAKLINDFQLFAEKRLAHGFNENILYILFHHGIVLDIVDF